VQRRDRASTANLFGREKSADLAQCQQQCADRAGAHKPVGLVLRLGNRFANLLAARADVDQEIERLHA